MEEIDQMFDAKIPAWRFGDYETEGLSHDLSVMEHKGGHVDAKTIEDMEDVEGNAGTGQVNVEVQHKT